MEEAERESRVGRTAEGADVPRGEQADESVIGGRGRVGRDRDAAREQREVFQSRDGSRPGQSIELSLRRPQRLSSRGKISVTTRRGRAIFPADRSRIARGAQHPHETREPPTLPRPPSVTGARGFLVQQPPVPVVAIAPSRDSAAIMPRARTRRAAEPDDGRRVARS